MFYLDKVSIYSRSSSCSVHFSHSILHNSSHSKLRPLHSRVLLSSSTNALRVFHILYMLLMFMKWSAMIPRQTPVAFHMLLSVVVIRHCLFPQTDVYSLGMGTSSWQSTVSSAFLGLKIFQLCSLYSCFDFYYKIYKCKWNHIVVSLVYCVL